MPVPADAGASRCDGTVQRGAMSGTDDAAAGDRSSAPPPSGAAGLHHQRLSLALEYPVYFTDDALAPENPVLRAALQRGDERRARVFAVIDGGLAEARPQTAAALERYCERHGEHLELLAEPVEVPGGERTKDGPAEVEQLQRHFQKQRLDRHAHVLVLGGGAVQDMAGYAAATTHRGLRVVRMPSTVLAQCDAGVGVKNGINAFGTKNVLGTFAAPAAVVNDLRLLDSLPARERVAGMAECVKVALIRDAGFFEWIVRRADALAAFEPAALGELIRRGAELHLRHIADAGDPFESGSARPLDYGHWSAHKLESLSRYALRHGEAVAIGMALDARYAHESGWLPEAALAAICGLLRRLGLRLWDEALERVDAQGRPLVLEGLEEFREHLGGELTVTLLADVGKGFEVHEIDAERVARSLAWLREQARR
jgi:3-dehydroquinate synthase